MAQNLTTRTVSGMTWSYVSTAAGAALQVGFSAILARLLDPAAFGIVAMAGVVIRFGSYFAQLGVGSAVVQKETLSRRDVHAAFLMASGMGLLFCVGMWVAAPAAVLLFRDPDLVPVVRALALSFLITGVSTSATAVLRRRLDFRTLTGVEVTAYLVGYGAVGVTMAYTGFGVWSLVGASLSQSAVHAVLVHLAVRHGVSLVRERSTYGHFVSYGGRISVSGFLDFVGGSLDVMTLGRFLGAAPLGFYNRAQMLAIVPMRKLGSGLARVLLPSFSRVQVDDERLRRVYLTTVGLMGAVIAPACVGLAVVAEDAVLLVLGPQWTPSIPVLRLLAVAVCVNMLTHPGAVLFEATARLNVKIGIQGAYIVVQAALFWMLLDVGLVGIALGFMLAEFGRHLAYAGVVRTALRVPWGGTLRAYAPALVNAAVIGTALYGLAHAGAALAVPRPVLFAAEVAAGSVLLLALTLFGPVSQTRTDALRILDRLPPSAGVDRLKGLLGRRRTRRRPTDFPS
jgi:O-antigen/teichoic acid export membrane protein